MHLIIDIGNTATKIAFFKDRELLQSNVLQGFPEQQLLSIINDAQFKKVILSSVKHFSHDFTAALSKEKVLLLSSTTKLPIQINYATPHTLGVDRIAAAVGATVLFPNENVLCFDLGSCITSEWITQEGTYHGGSISPGMNLRFKAMNTFTDKLPLVSAGSEKVTLPGNSTESCMRAGVVNGIAYEIKGTIDFYASKYTALKVVFTGGDATYFESLLNMNIFVQPNLVLMGLNEILICHEF
jgi:type III pantothenate kinase